MLTNTLNALNEIKSQTFKISATKNGECIHQTQRNNLGATLRTALVEDFTKIFPITDDANAIVAYLTEDGLVLEVPNASIQDNLTEVEGSGAISIELGFSIKNLRYNAQDESEAYKVKVAEKEAKAKAEAEKKAKNIAKDKAMREAKAKAKAEKGV